VGTDQILNTAGVASAAATEHRRCIEARRRMLDLASSLPEQPTGLDLFLFCEALDRAMHIIDNEMLLVCRAMRVVAMGTEEIRRERMRLCAEAPQVYLPRR